MGALKNRVISKVDELGVKEASKFFGVSIGTASNWLAGKTSPPIDALELVMSDVPEEPKEVPMHYELVQWQGRKVAMLLPVYRTMNPDTHFTLFANYVAYGPEKIAMPKPVKGTCIWEARNKLIHKGMQLPDAETFIMGDDDMILPHGNAASFNESYGARLTPRQGSFNAISRLMESGRDRGIVGTHYYGRHEHGRAQCHLGFSDANSNEKLRRGEYSGYIPMEWVGTGWIKIERWVIEKMRAAIDGGMWPECKPHRADLWYGYFNPTAVGVGEDLSFCLRAGKLGIQSYLDADLVALHAGECNFGPKNTKQ